MTCRSCTSENPDGDAFCEFCGVRLASTQEVATACVCGAVDGPDEEGFCMRCGRRLQRSPSDHVERQWGDHLAGISDRGQVHERNQDRFVCMELPGAVLMVLCDGVSSTRNADDAAALAAEALAEGIRSRLDEFVEGNEEAAFQTVFAETVDRLGRSAGADRRREPPSTTAVVALVRDRKLFLAWTGDSRAYWVATNHARCLTRDHSGLENLLREQNLPREQALALPEAHAITRWLSADARSEALPEVVVETLAEEGTVLLCSDGLWNALSSTDELPALLAGDSGLGEPALAQASRLVLFANQAGGEDNITVVLLHVPAVTADQNCGQEVNHDARDDVPRETGTE